MSGNLPTRKTPSGRRQWSINGNQEGSLKRLRNQLANDGCPESQFVLASKLLEDYDREENARLGVYWLMKASEQGNGEATEVLKQCFKSGKGIDEHNYLDVKMCISMSQDEKVGRKAARDVFASLSNGCDYITSTQLERRILEIELSDQAGSSTTCQPNSCSLSDGSPGDASAASSSNGHLLDADIIENNQQSQKQIDWNERSENNQKLTEENIILAAVNYTQGQLPVLNKSLCLYDPNLRALDRLPVLHRTLFHPLLALKLLYHNLIHFLSLLTFHVSSDVRLLFIFLVYITMATDNPLYIVPLLLYYATICCLVVTTCRMLRTNRDFGDFRLWSGLFLTYSEGELNAEQAEFQFIRGNMRPYLHYFGALLLNLMCYPLISSQFLIQSEITVLSFCLTIMTLIGFLYKKRGKIIVDYLILLSFGLNVLAKYPYESDEVVAQGWRFLDLKIPTFASYIIGNGIEFCITFRILLYAVIPVIFVRIAARENWRGIYKYLIPHCVTLSWLQMVIISSQGATMYGLIRGTLALVGVVLFLPLVGLMTVLIPVTAVTKYALTVSTVNHIYFTCSLFIFVFVLAIITYVSLAKSRFKYYSVFLQALFTVISVYFLSQSLSLNQIQDFTTSEQGVMPKSLSFDQYERLCNNANDLSTSMKCAELNGLQIQWEGYVHSITMTSTSNAVKYLFDYLPEFVRRPFYCYYGDPIESNCQFNDDDCIAFYDSIKYINGCSLEKYTRYTFAITIGSTLNDDYGTTATLWGGSHYNNEEGSSKIHLILTNSFTNTTKYLNKGDLILFKGILNRYDNQLTTQKHVHQVVTLNEISCIDCAIKNVDKHSQESYSYSTMEYLKSSLVAILHFLFYPVIIFKS